MTNVVVKQCNVIGCLRCTAHKMSSPVSLDNFSLVPRPSKLISAGAEKTAWAPLFPPPPPKLGGGGGGAGKLRYVSVIYV